MGSDYLLKNIYILIFSYFTYNFLFSQLRVRGVTRGIRLPVVVHVLVGVVHTEGFIDGGALVHEAYGAPGVSGDIADSQKSAERERKRFQEVKATR